MASLQGGQQSQDFGGPNTDQSPLSMNLDFLKSLTDKKTRDGNPPKRRGPKPDSKPALTRRQELNRQAQRTHRERKELYIKALEDEVLRLKEVYSNVSQDKVRLAEENRRLKAMMSQRNASGGGPGSSLLDDVVSNPSIGHSGSVAGSAASHGHSHPGVPSSNTSVYTTPPPLPAMQAPTMTCRPNPNLDYDQAGIDFVLHLEKPCMSHMPWLLDRGSKAGGEPCGHALMASCPPEPFPSLSPEIPFGFSNVKGSTSRAISTDEIGQQTWELSKGDLATLLELSARLNLDGEITPVMAWGMVLAHPRLGELGVTDFGRLAEELFGKVRCYGFGAVMEEFEVRDALENLFSMKPDLFPAMTMTATVQGAYVAAF